jgi:hypothetical protein
MQNTELRMAVDRFVEDITAAIHSSVREALGSALGEELLSRKGGRVGRGVRRVGRGVGGVARGAAPTLGRKRAPEQLEALTGKLRDYIAKNPGQRIEQIGAGLGIATKELALPARKLLADKQLSKRGQKRATTYFAK